MLVLLASLLAIVSIGGLLLVGQFGVIALYFSKPIIDATWDANIAGVNLLQIVGVVFPIIVIMRSFWGKTQIKYMPLFKIWMIYIIYNALVFSFLAVERSVIDWIDLTFRALNGLVGFYIMQAYFQDREKFRRLLVVLIIAGAFPLLVGLYQLYTGQIWRENITVGLVRHNGLYHSILTVKVFVFQTITALFLYFSYFFKNKTSFIMKVVLVTMMSLALLVLYKTYSKSAVLVFALWLVIWAISSRKIIHTVVLFILFGFAASFYHNEIIDELAQLFSKELTVVESEDVDAWTFRRIFAGRVFSWYGAMEHFSQRSIFEQVFGDGNPANIHNDYLAKLLSGGILGLTIYIGLLFAIGRKLLANWLHRRTPLDVMGVMIYAMVLIDSVGIHVTQYTSYQWYVWGFIGLALQGLKTEPKLGVQARHLVAIQAGERAR